jgi:hypothetical protein
VAFASQGSGLTTLNGVVADDFVLTTNAGALAPAVVLTAPVAGLELTGPAVVTVGALAVDAGSVTGVGFYANGSWIGSVAGAGPYSLQWTNPGVGGYGLTAVATNGAGLVRTSAVVNMAILPGAFEFGILTQPQSQEAAAGSSVSFEVVTTGTNAVSYQWYDNGLALPGQTGATLTLYPVAGGNAGTYTVQATSGSQTLTSAGAVLTVLAPPVFTVQPQGQTVGVGANVTLSNAVEGDGPLNWQWLLNGTGIAGATDQSYSILAAQPLNSGKYQVVVGNPVAFSVSAVANVVVQAGNGLVKTADNFAGRISINPLLGAVMGNNQNAVFEDGDPTQIAGKPAGKVIWYTWKASFTGVMSLTTLGSDFDTLLGVYTGTNLSRLTLVAADDDSGGYFTSLVSFNVAAGTDYQIAVGGFNGASGEVVLGMPAGTGYRVLSQASGNSVPGITRQPTNQLVLAGAKVTLSVGATNAQTYQWYFQGSPVNGGSNSSLVIPNFQPGSVGLYEALVANAVGSVYSQQASLQIAVINQPGATNSAHDKFGDAVELAGGSKAVEPREPAAGGGDTRGFSISQTFSTVGATKDTGEPSHCGQVGGSSQWYIYTAPGAGTLHVGTAGSTFNTILAVYTGPGTNFASLVEQGCDYTTNYQTKQPNVILPGVAAGTRFYIVVDGYHGVSGRAQLQVGLGQAPTLAVGPADRFATPGSNATFSVSAFGSTNLYYQWRLNGANLGRATNSSYTVTNAQAGSAGSYSVVVSNVVGVVTSAPPAVLTLQYAPGINTQPTNQTVVLGKAGGFTVGVAGINVKTNALRYQWYYLNGAPVAKATNSALAFPAAQWTNHGSYYVIITNNYGAATSTVAVLTVQDPTPPAVAITTPANKTVTTAGLVTVSGTAKDNVGVGQVRVKVNTNNYQAAATANHWTNWTLTNVALAPGTNLITAQSLDLQGNTNALPAQSVVFYKTLSTLTVRTNGTGKVTSSSGATNGASLIVGTNYTILATIPPGKTWIFSNWTSGTSVGALAYASSRSNLTFIMSSNLILQANFITNPFPAVAGTYTGLFYPANGVTEASSGYFVASIVSNSAGAYSANLKLDGGAYPFSGSFDATGTVQTNLARTGKTPVSVTLNLHLNPADDQMSGTVSGTVSNVAWTSVLQADRAVFNASTAPATNYAGQFTLLVPPGPAAPAGSPDGYGYALLTNTLGGASILSGALADGAILGPTSAPIAKDGSIPLYNSLYSGKGSLLGWIIITNQPPQTLDGQISWIKPAVAKTLYPLGFTNAASVLGSPYTRPAAGAPVLDLTNGTLTLSNGNLTTPLIYTVGLTRGNVLTNTGTSPTNSLAIVLNPTNGLLKVTFRAPGAKTNTVGSGAVLQNQTNALGSFLGPNQSGAIILK